MVKDKLTEEQVWLTPETRRRLGLSKIEVCYSIEGKICSVMLHRHFIEGVVVYVPEDKTESEATWLCLAVEKLIDGSS